MPTNTYPLAKFHFRVDWGGERVGFTEVTGLDMQVEPIEYREGNSPEYSKIKMPGMRKFSNITLKRGSVALDTDFYKWINTISLNTAERRDVTIKLLDEGHNPVLAWTAKNAFPIKLQASDLKADGNEVAIETLELAHEGLSLLEQAGGIGMASTPSAGGYYPPVGFHFRVEFVNIGNDNDIRFQSVAGLNVEYDMEAFKEGGENRFEHKLPVRTKYPDLSLKRGMLTDSDVIKWCLDAFQNRVFRPAQVNVSLLNEEHDPLRTWQVMRAWPKKWAVSDLNAAENSIVIETLELSYSHFTLA